MHKYFSIGQIASVMKKIPVHKGIFIQVVLFILALSCSSTYANVRIMSYNIKDFWLRFDGEPGSITDEGAQLDKDDLEKIEIVAGVINREKPDLIGILESASLAELLFSNERFLEEEYRCRSQSSLIGCKK